MRKFLYNLGVALEAMLNFTDKQVIISYYDNYYNYDYPKTINCASIKLLWFSYVLRGSKLIISVYSIKHILFLIKYKKFSAIKNSILKFESFSIERKK